MQIVLVLTYIRRAAELAGTTVDTSFNRPARDVAICTVHAVIIRFRPKHRPNHRVVVHRTRDPESNRKPGQERRSMVNSAGQFRLNLVHLIDNNQDQPGVEEPAVV